MSARRKFYCLPSAFTEKKGVEKGINGWIGYTVSQGRKHDEGRTCEDMIFTGWHGQLALVLMVDGHGGHRCAQYVVEYFKKMFPAESFCCHKARQLCSGVMPPPSPQQAVRDWLACHLDCVANI
jgi:serine/threonine protein phosphatase PrpC